MDADAQVVVIGAGVVGCAVAEHLVGLGWDGVVVIDQGPLFDTGGSTSHSPATFYQVNPSQTMSRFARYTIDHWRDLLHDGEPCFHPVGSVEVARTPERLEWLKLRHGLAGSWGVRSRLIEPDEAAALVPVLDPRAIRGGLHVLDDGVASVWAAEEMARTACRGGARFEGGVEVTGIEVAGGRVRAVETSRGTIRTGLVVTCAGVWGPLLGRMAGVAVPLLPMQHQFAWTGPIRQLAGEAREVGHPIVRDEDCDLYYRQRGDRYGIGSVQHRAMPVRPEDLPSPGRTRAPAVMPFTERDFAGAWRDVVTLFPPLAEAGVEHAFNGLVAVTPDGNPIIGEAPGVRGFWVAEASFVTHAAGVGRAVAEWIVEGEPGIDVRDCDLSRFERFASGPSYLRARASQVFDRNYDMVHPLSPMEEPRPLRVSPFHARQRELGAFFLDVHGWERPHWFEANAALASGVEVPRPHDWTARYWSPIPAAEHVATRERAALYDLTSQRRLEVTGPGALGFLQMLTTNDLDRGPGAVTYALMLDGRGGIRADVVVARLEECRFQVRVNRPGDVHWLARNLPGGGSVAVRDVTGGTCCVGLWGPRAREVLQPLTDDDLTNDGLAFSRAREIHVREVPVTALRLSSAGELGWELHASAEFGLRLWDLLWEAGRPHGLVAAGAGALNGLRIEKGYRVWGQDMWTEHDPFEAGLGFAVRQDKGDFVGREAVQRRRLASPRRRLACLTIGDGTVMMGKEPVYAGAEPVGFVTSSAYGCSVGRSIAFGWLPGELAVPGTSLEVQYLAERHPATVVADPLFDPDMTRILG